MFEELIKEYDSLVKEYKTLVIDTFNKQDFIAYNEILFSAHNCGIEGNSFSVDETRALKEKGLGCLRGKPCHASDDTGSQVSWIL